MAPRGRGQDVGDDEVHETLQAILLADSFTQRFRPITMERPKVLLPLVALPVIDYTLEWLASAGVEEVFVFCCAHAKQVTRYLEGSKWKSQPRFKVICIESHDCASVGDALRCMDEKNVIRGDFVLVSGDTISNMPLKEVLLEHKTRRKRDKLAVMTMVIKRAKLSPLTYQTRLGNDELVIALDPDTKQLLHYGQSVNLDKTLLTDRPRLQLHADMQDCRIDICSPEVLMLFTDNFDYQQMRRDFVRGLLSDEVMGNKLYTYEIHEEYAARIDNFRAYDTVSKDVLRRWTYPLVPDIPFSDRQAPVLLDRSNKYREQGVSVARTAVIGEDTFVGENTVIGEHSRVRNSIVGRGCKIGSNVRIEGSYIWDNVIIHDGVEVHQSLICDEATIKAGARLEPGVVLSFKVVIGDNFIVPAYSKISRIRQPMEEDSSDEDLEGGTEDSNDVKKVDGTLTESGDWEESEVGSEGAGFKWFLDEEPDWKHSVAPIPLDKMKELLARKESEDAVQGLDADSGTKRNQSEVAEEDSEDDDHDNFDKEVDETFRRAVGGVQQDNVVLEVNALKLAYNKEFSDCAGAMFKSVLTLATEAPHSSSAELLTQARESIKKWASLLRCFLKSVDDEIEVLLKFEEICSEDGREFSPFFSQILAELYDQDVVSEDAVLSWASEKEGAEESDKVYLNQCQRFIQWLREASEEEDDDDEEEDD